MMFGTPLSPSSLISVLFDLVLHSERPHLPSSSPPRGAGDQRECPLAPTARGFWSERIPYHIDGGLHPAIIVPRSTVTSAQYHFAQRARLSFIYPVRVQPKASNHRRARVKLRLKRSGSTENRICAFGMLLFREGHLSDAEWVWCFFCRRAAVEAFPPVY